MIFNTHYKSLKVKIQTLVYSLSLGRFTTGSTSSTLMFALVLVDGPGGGMEEIGSTKGGWEAWGLRGGVGCLGCGVGWVG